MPDLDGNLFLGESDIGETDMFNCEANNNGSAVTNIFTDYGWGGRAACGILLHLSPSNDRVVAGCFMTKGTEETDFKLAATKIWADADPSVTVTIVLPSLDSFGYSDGGLTSDFLPDDEVVHYFHVITDGGPPAPILTNDIKRFGLGRFCLRLVCHLAKNSNPKHGLKVKYTTMLYPAGVGELRNMSHLVSSASWPGLKLGEAECPMIPAPTTAWCCPELPIPRPAVSFTVATTPPSGAALRQAISGIMRRCALPEVARNPTSLATKWEKLVKEPGSLAAREPPTTWPEAKAPTANTGKLSKIIKIVIYICNTQLGWITDPETRHNWLDNRLAHTNTATPNTRTHSRPHNTETHTHTPIPMQHNIE